MCLGVPARIIEILDPAAPTALAEVGGVRRSVNLACVLESDPPEALVGQWVLVHVGFAMSRIDAREAERTLALLAALEGDGP